MKKYINPCGRSFPLQLLNFNLANYGWPKRSRKRFASNFLISRDVLSKALFRTFSHFIQNLSGQLVGHFPKRVKLESPFPQFLLIKEPINKLDDTWVIYFRQNRNFIVVIFHFFLIFQFYDFCGGVVPSDFVAHFENISERSIAELLELVPLRIRINVALFMVFFWYIYLLYYSKRFEKYSRKNC